MQSMTDTAIIRLDLGIPAGSPMCGECEQFRVNDAPRKLYECFIFGRLERDESRLRHVDCLAAEQRFSPDPPTEEGWYWARLRRTGKWRIVEVTMVFGELRAYSVVGKYGRSLTHFDSWSTRLTMPGGE